MFVNAKTFSAETGFPLRTLISYIRTGKVPCHRVGRSYVLDKEKTLERLETISIQETNGSYGNKTGRMRHKQLVAPVSSGMSFEERIRYMQQKLKNGYKEPDA